MQIATDRSNLKDIYSPCSKVFISARDRDFFLKLKLNTQINIYELNYDPNSRSQILKLLPDNTNNDFDKPKLVRIQLVPNFCLGFVTFFPIRKGRIN